jgi:purine-binding chemotaxis protein CheW
MKNNESSRKVIFLKLQDKVYGLFLSSVREVIAATSVAELPVMPSSFAGLINLRGKIVSTYFLSKLLKQSSKHEKILSEGKTCAVIIEVNKNLLGLIVDEVCEVLHIKNSEIELGDSAQEKKDLNFFGLYKKSDNSLVPILDIEKLIEASININKAA